MRAPRTAEAMATVPNCGMLRALQRRRESVGSESASRALRCAATHPIFSQGRAPCQPRTSCRHILFSQHYLVAMSQLVQRCSPTTGRMPRSILGLTAGALSGWAVWRISSMRTHTTL